MATATSLPALKRAHYLYFVAGALIFLALHLYFVLTWQALYAQHLWTGYAPGRLPAFFNSSPDSLLVTNVVLFAAALGLTLLPAGRVRWAGVALWVGVIAAIVAVWIATPQLRHDSNMWPIDLVVLSVMTGVPMLVGRVIGLLYWRIRNGLSPKA